MGRLSERFSGLAWRKGKKSAFHKAFYRKFGVKFKDPVLLEHALTHRSSLGPNDAVISNERLEFLGDSVLGLVCTEALFRSLPGADEGALTKARSRIVNKGFLGKVGLALGILDVLKFARDEIKDDERALLTLSADALEAVIGAIYLDRGFNTAVRFVEHNVVMAAPDESEEHFQVDYKSRLQEICQAEFKVQPQYKVVRRMGPEHRKIFHVEAIIRGRPYGFGAGRSKKEAEQQAAGQAMRKITGRNKSPGQ